MSIFKWEDKFVFNENYLLKYDKKRFELMEYQTHNLFRDVNENDSAEDIYLPIHPMLALLLHFFDGNRSVLQVIEEFSSVTRFNKNYIEEFVKNMIKELYCSKKGKYLKFGDYIFYLPRNLFLKNNNIKIKKKINLDDFMIPKDDLDLDSFRSYIPSDCTLEVNFSCLTDCIYCYADRRKNKKCTIPVERLKEIIKDARDLNMRSFDFSGGEVFLYENWECLVKELLDNGFTPYISTKIPLSEKIINKIKDLGLEGIQFSIDSIDNNELRRLLSVNDDYLTNMIKSIEALDRIGIKIAINSQICAINDNLANVRKMLDFFVNLNNIKSIRLGAAGYSIYKSQENFNRIVPALKIIKKIEELLETYKDKYKNISISFSGYDARVSANYKYEEKEKNFSERARCSGNFYAFIILPDGKVTICEELYNHPRFIIGDLMKQTITEIWNSDKALGLYNFTRDEVREESACKKCEGFDSCHTKKGVCWRNVLIAYGYENWDYPDPRCPKAPQPFNVYWMK